jgi:hypothetical protein
MSVSGTRAISSRCVWALARAASPLASARWSWTSAGSKVTPKPRVAPRRPCRARSRQPHGVAERDRRAPGDRGLAVAEPARPGETDGAIGQRASSTVSPRSTAARRRRRPPAPVSRQYRDRREEERHAQVRVEGRHARWRRPRRRPRAHPARRGPGDGRPERLRAEGEVVVAHVGEPPDRLTLPTFSAPTRRQASVAPPRCGAPSRRGPAAAALTARWRPGHGRRSRSHGPRSRPRRRPVSAGARAIRESR